MKIDEITSLFQSAFLNTSNDSSNFIDIRHVSVDSNNILEDAAFCALKGASTDGHLYCQQAVDNGARLIISENKVDVEIPNLVVKDLSKELNVLIEKLYPLGREFRGLIGITGTNGKSTIATLIKKIYDELGENCGLIGTILYSDGIDEEIATHTTPPYHSILRLLNQASQKHINHCVIEASSHALSQNRLGNLKLEAAIFTNLTQDHLDYHETIESYEKDKLKLLDYVSENGIVIVNLDNNFGKKINQLCKKNVVSVGRDSNAKYLISEEKLNIEGCDFKLTFSNHSYDVKTQLIGNYNIDNIAQVIVFFTELGYQIDDVLKIIRKFKGVSGRVERVCIDSSSGPQVIVDYAHTHDAMDNVLKSVAPLKKHDLWVVFGCGGDRDRKKRPLMGAVSEQYGDRIILTNDNPRTEDPLDIIEEVEKGFTTKSFNIIPDRKQAIEFAISNADDQDIVMILGKGHEDYQILGDRTIEFDDRIVAKAALEKRKIGS
ncbi:MAG: UDP-N-acetylmuramoyl-L-alanyl-D-glutamate--2,6-diaminopimelate ligase [Planctomycetota bacterium]|nr:MAG: UDP-N-acetylmuramoyl-L-alanyl-D-glutamate--2,6-diaminopimelate ligase [Planctomycetota bacterium]